jgi:thiol:disulfide interchange protein DsbD
MLGAGLLFIYAMGIGVPFFLIGVFALRLPKAGVWMDWVKSVFGVALVALAAAYLRDGFGPLRDLVAGAGAALGRVGGIGLAAALAFIGVMLGALHLSFKAQGEWLPKGLGVAALVVAFLVRMAATGPGPAAAPVDGQVVPSTFSWTLKYDPEKAKAVTPFDEALQKAKADCRPVMIDFFADWCASCKELDQHTYVAREVIDESKRFVNVKVDGTGDNDALNELYGRYGIQGLPTVVFIDPMGKVLDSPRVTGFLPPEKFVAEMHKVSPLTACARTP